MVQCLCLSQRGGCATSKRAEDHGVDHLPVIQFDYAYVSSGDARGQQVKMRTILDTSTGYGTACVIDVKSAGDKYAIFSAVSFLKELEYTRFRCRTDPETAIKTHVDTVIKCGGRSSRRAGFARGDYSRESRESGCFGRMTQSFAGTNPSFATGR